MASIRRAITKRVQTKTGQNGRRVQNGPSRHGPSKGRTTGGVHRKIEKTGILMCLYPTIIPNKKYTATKKNGGIIPPVRDKRVMAVAIGCGRCAECMKKKANDWKIRLYEEIKGGYIDKMSFAFTVSEESYNKEERTRRITGIKRLYDVAAVDLPAYDSTSISARLFFEAEAERERAEALEREKHKQRIKNLTHLIS